MLLLENQSEPSSPAKAGDPVFQRRLRINREAAAYWIVRSSSTYLALARSRPMRFFGSAMRRPSRRGVSPALCRCPAFQALLKRIHQADDVVRLLLGLGGPDRLAGGLALDQRLQRVLVLVLEFRPIEIRGLAVEDMAFKFHHFFSNLLVFYFVG